MKLLSNKVKLIITCLILLSSCLNKYEKDAIGIYEVDEYELINSAKTLDLPRLNLEKNKIFSLKVGSSTYSGTWKANDSGDWTLIEFFFKNSGTTQGMVGNNTIKILNPSTAFLCPNFKTLVLKKVK